jgi:hypothetical protein
MCQIILVKMAQIIVRTTKAYSPRGGGLTKKIQDSHHFLWTIISTLTRQIIFKKNRNSFKILKLYILHNFL